MHGSAHVTAALLPEDGHAFFDAGRAQDRFVADSFTAKAVVVDNDGRILGVGTFPAAGFDGSTAETAQHRLDAEGNHACNVVFQDKADYEANMCDCIKKWDWAQEPDASYLVSPVPYDGLYGFSAAIRVSKSNGGFKFDPETGDPYVYYTVTLTNISGRDLYGLRISDGMTMTVTDNDTGEPMDCIDLSFSEWKVDGVDVDVFESDGGMRHDLWAAGRNDVFEKDRVIVLTYRVDAVRTDDGPSYVKVDLYNLVTGGTWFRPSEASAYSLRQTAGEEPDAAASAASHVSDGGSDGQAVFSARGGGCPMPFLKHPDALWDTDGYEFLGIKDASGLECAPGQLVGDFTYGKDVYLDDSAWERLGAGAVVHEVDDAYSDVWYVFRAPNYEDLPSTGGEGVAILASLGCIGLLAGFMIVMARRREE